MSEQGTIYGCIFGTGLIGSPKTNEIYRLNKAAVEALPDKQDWEQTVLIRSIFHVPMPDTEYFYRLQVIHFGTAINHLDAYWETWFNQFEALLRTLYWLEAHVHMEAEGFGKHSYYWEADLTPMRSDPPEPIREWKFTGGPRRF
jgi:hypothetical protein